MNQELTVLFLRALWTRSHLAWEMDAVRGYGLLLLGKLIWILIIRQEKLVFITGFELASFVKGFELVIHK